MAIRFYDEAITNKIQNWINDPNLHVYRPDETSHMLQRKSDEADDKPISLPFIALSRDRDINILNPNKNPLSYEGMKLRFIDNKTGKEVHLKSAYRLNAIPIGITYQLDIYTKGIAEADEYFRNFVFNLVNFPKVSITIPYLGVNLEHKSSLTLETRAEDNSDIPQRLFPGQFTRYSIRFTIDDAYIFSVINQNNVVMDSLSIDMVTKEANGEIIDEEEEIESF